LLFCHIVLLFFDCHLILTRSNPLNNAWAISLPTVPRLAISWISLASRSICRLISLPAVEKFRGSNPLKNLIQSASPPHRLGIAHPALLTAVNGNIKIWNFTKS